jgi:hypothetical protein
VIAYALALWLAAGFASAGRLVLAAGWAQVSEDRDVPAAPALLFGLFVAVLAAAYSALWPLALLVRAARGRPLRTAPAP